MMASLKFRSDGRRKAGEIYGVIVTQARQPVFYETFGVPDTPEGRYELLVLHLHLVLKRLLAVLPAEAPLPRMLVEAFVADMDDSLRELGTGDLAVPRRVRRAAAGLYERSKVYGAAGLGGAGALPDALTAHVFDGAPSLKAEEFAAYVGAAAAQLAALDDAAVLAGDVSFPQPAAKEVA